MERIHIREMMDSDWDAISRIYQLGIDSNLTTFEQQCPSLQEWDHSHAKECRFVAVVGDNVVGWVALTPVSGRCVYAGVADISIYVDPASHRQGVSRLLFIVKDQFGKWRNTVLMEHRNETR